MTPSDMLIQQDDISVVTSNVLVADTVADTSVVESEPIIQAFAEQYVLSSGGIYGSNGLVGAVPKWILDAIQQELTTGDGNITSVLSDMQILLDSLQDGVNQAVTSFNSQIESANALTTTVSSRVDSNHADVINLLATKVTPTESQAIATTAIQSVFGANASAFVGNIASTYVDANSAIAQDVALLTSELNGHSASINEISSLTTETIINPLWVNDGLNTDPDINGQPKFITRALAKKELIVDADGVITGFLAESGETSNFQINADNFRVTATGQQVASRNPFAVNATTGDITFNGKVSFNSVTDAPELVAENTNINMTNNLVNAEGWIASTHSDYLFIGTPLVTTAIGASGYAELQVDIASGDEVYTPYITDFTKSYSISYAFKGSNAAKLYKITATDSVTSVDIVPSLVVLDANAWYLAQTQVMPFGTTPVNTFGSIRKASDLSLVAGLNDLVLDSDTTKFALGWTETQLMSRPRIEVLTNDTQSINYVTPGALVPYAKTDMSNVTTIDGGKITTGSIPSATIIGGVGVPVFYQTATPTTNVTNAIWFDTDDNYHQYIWNGTTWVNASTDVATWINTNTTTINGGKITTDSIDAGVLKANSVVANNIAINSINAGHIAAGTITAAQIATGTITATQIAANTITASKISAGAVTADKISVSSLSAVNANLGSVTAGILSASKFQVNGLTAFNSSYPNNTAPMVISQFQAWSGTAGKTLTFYGASYGSGHRADRFVASTTKFMIDFSATTTVWADTYAYIDATISGTGITTQTIRINSTNRDCSIAVASSVTQTTSITFSVSFTTHGTIIQPVCTLRAFGFNTE